MEVPLTLCRGALHLDHCRPCLTAWDFHRGGVKLAGRAGPSLPNDTMCLSSKSHPTCETNIRRCCWNSLKQYEAIQVWNNKQFRTCPMLAAPSGSRSIWSKTYSKPSSPCHHHSSHAFDLKSHSYPLSLPAHGFFPWDAAPNPGDLHHMHFLLLRRCIPSNSNLCSKGGVFDARGQTPWNFSGSTPLFSEEPLPTPMFPLLLGSNLPYKNDVVVRDIKHTISLQDQELFSWVCTLCGDVHSRSVKALRYVLQII